MPEYYDMVKLNLNRKPEKIELFDEDIYYAKAVNE
jgi:hypothetical protein